MVIYGTALLSACLLTGLVLGKVIGTLLGIPANVGGAGIAMLLLIWICHRQQQAGRLSSETQQGLRFWGALYIPVVVAMAASQNVLGALDGGVIAAIASVITVFICFTLVPVICRMGADKSDLSGGRQRNSL